MSGGNSVGEISYKQPNRTERAAEDKKCPEIDCSSYPKTMNILILGETGIGKSTFINSLANYMNFETLDDALLRHVENRIESKFELRDQQIGIVAHEFAHALGFEHMQVRYDRDQYITVVDKNIEPGEEDNFEKLTIDESIYYSPYEYGGMMQYPVNSYSATPDITDSSSFTMIPKDINYVHTMGNTMTTFYDMKMENQHYGCLG